MRDFHHTQDPSPRRKPGPIFPREQRRPLALIQGVPAFAGMTVVRRGETFLVIFTGDSLIYESG
jgi:hypothetical protein